MEGQYAALKVYLGQSGTLTAFEIRFSYNRGKDVKNQLVVLAKTDSGELLTPGNAEHLLFVPAYSKSLERIIDENEFADYQAQVIDEQTLQTEAELDNYLEQESDKLERWADDRRKVLMETVDELAEDIHQLKKASRQLASMAEKIQAKKELRKLERKRDDALHEYHESRKVIEQEEDRLLDEVAEKLELTCEVRNLFTIRWTLTH
ncbi:hypothetical protein [Marinobacter sp. ELB17]|uniref:hypothetical protein n=1 Tax=Marinobacter sp. ELB17 TaxID=270374 RepID=UPI0000F38E3B|nr:hypothetical protein [Marinobacter sp. ELB17]EBA00915.1 helicase [Marinobacter sp. ELB17]